MTEKKKPSNLYNHKIVKVGTQQRPYNNTNNKGTDNMAYKTKLDAKAEKIIKLGGKDERGKPNPTKVEGYYLGAKNTDGQYGPGFLHIFKTVEGNVGLFGKTNSNRLLSKDHVGQMVLLEFTGMSTPKKGRAAAYEFKLSYDEEDVVDTAGLNLNVAAASEDEESDGVADDEEETDLGSEDEQLDEVAPQRPIKQVARPADPAAQKARMQQLLNRK